jgi:hypothetical protein
LTLSDRRLKRAAGLETATIIGDQAPKPRVFHYGFFSDLPRTIAVVDMPFTPEQMATLKSGSKPTRRLQPEENDG